MIDKGSRIKKDDSKLRAELSEKTYQLKIESSLENVRLTAMKMKKADDLLNICRSLFKELAKLGFTDLRNAMINIHNDSEKSFVNFDYSDEIGKSVNRFTNNILPFVGKIIKTSHSANDAFSESYVTGKAFAEFKKLRKQSGQKEDPRLSRADSIYFYFYSIGIGSIGISTFSKISEEKKVLLKRFRNVFNLSYQRYIDISNAEAQAREAQIQLALERVRARTNAMQKSDELPDTTFVLFQQLRELGETAAQISLGVIKEEEGVVELSATVHGKPMPQVYKVPIDEPYLMKKAIKAWKAKQKSAKVEIKGQELKRYNQWRNSVLKKKIKFPEDQWIVNIVFFSRGLMSFSSAKQINYETLQLLERFAAVFDQTYTRFLDLKKAEAQAKEAQIESALEKVRGEAMAMHKSEELRKVITVVSEQMQHLNFRFSHVSFIVNNEDYDLHFWSATPFQSNPFELHVPFLDSTAVNNLKKARKKGLDFFSDILTPEENHHWSHHMIEYSELKDASHEVKAYLSTRGALARSLVLTKHITLVIGNYLGRPYTEEENAIFKRFGSVFEQSYTRFLDLQTAEGQAREAQIETALEKVRSRSLAMHRSEELQDVVHTVFEKLKELKVDFYTVIIVIFRENSKDIFWWLEAQENQRYPKIHIPYADIPYLRDLFEARKTRLPLLSKCYYGKEKDKLYHHLFTNTDFKNVPEKQKKFLLDRDFAAMSTALAKNTGIHITNYFKESFSDDENEILQRFAKVFDQAYTRFLDLQKVEAQARESQIEAALEKVRSRSLAMHNADELKDVITVLREKLKELGIAMESRTVLILTLKEGSKDFTQWVATPEDEMGNSTSSCFETPYFANPILIDFWQTKEKGLNFLAKVYTPEEKNSFFKYLFENTDSRNVSQENKDRVLKAGYYAVSTAIESNSAIIISNFSGQLLSDKENEILKRFGRVFEQAYIRFLDLQKVEAQAREAQIEAALEKVRSRSLAMHRSDELREVVAVVFDKLKELRFAMDDGAAIILIFSEGSKDHIQWIADWEQSFPREFKVRFSDHAMPFDIINEKQNGVDFFSKIYPFEEKNRYLKYLFATNEDFKKLPNHLKKTLLRSRHYGFSVAFEKNSGILIATITGKLVTNDQKEILKRFAKVFEQSYTRFLDLQKAEAQAREAQIEAALEKVRSRSLAMHASDELQDVVKSVFDRMDELHIELSSAIIMIFTEGSRDSVWWLVNKNNQQFSRIAIKYTDHPFFRDLYEARESGNEILTKSYSASEKKTVFTYFFEQTDFKYAPEEQKQFLLSTPHLIVSEGLAGNIGLQLTRHFEKNFSEEDNEIIMRFAKVFNQAYTRFLDLQKAEAQAREAQIQLALERVRARSLAMHQTDELQDVVNIVAQQLHHINIDINGGVFIAINNEVNSDIPLWASAGAADYAQKVVVPFLNKPIFTCLRDALIRRNNFLVEEYSREEKISFFENLFKHAPWDSAPQERKQELLSREGGYTRSVAISKHTSIAIINHYGRKFSDEDNEILQRFGKVFEQSYVRFLDLQKAEAQAREAQIEAALERVRGKAMAMHNSNDLSITANTIFVELQKLGIHTVRSGVGLLGKEPHTVLLYAATASMDSEELALMGQIDMSRNPYLKMEYESCVRKENYFLVLGGEELKSYYHDIIAQINVPSLTEEQLQHKHYGYYFPFSEGYFYAWSETEYSESEISILNRFKTIVGLTFRRYLDLQKAEAQAREAQIEAALERVRSRTMAMHKSGELGEVASLLFKQVMDLGIKTWTTGFNIWSEDNNFWVDYVTNPRGGLIEPYTVHATQFEVFTEVSEARKRGDEFLVQYVEGEMLKELYRHLGEFGDRKQFEKILEAGFEFPSHQYHHFVFGSKVSLLFITYEPVPEAHDIFKRFGKVFEQTYTRFLDLQKAEAQANEARIESALEKIRSTSLAMHRSNEIVNVVSILFEKLKDLGLIFDGGAGIILFTEGSRDAVIGVISPELSTPTFHNLPYDQEAFVDNPIALDEWRGKDEGIDVINKIYSFEQKNKYFHYVFKHNDESKLPKSLRQFILDANSYTATFIAEKNSLLVANSWTKQLFSEENVAVLRRVARVFEQAYIRFLDLQKAEAQARESQIQLALERVRARTMAMQKSDELAEVAGVLFKQVTELGIKTWTTGFNVWSEDNNSYVDYVTSPHGGFMDPYVVDTSEAEVLHEISEARKRGDDFFVQYAEGERLKESYGALTRFGDKKQFEKLLEDGFEFPSEQYDHFVFGSKVSLLFITYEPVPEAHDIFKRFGRAFEQTYTRFLDLKKAEASARESQIQLALERVRARTMAMQKSEELNEVAALLFEQVSYLGIKIWTTGFKVWSEDNNFFTDYVTNPDGGFIEPYTVDSTQYGVFAEISDAKKRREEFFVKYEEGEQLAETYRELSKFGEQQFKTLVDRGFQFPTKQYEHYVFGSKASLMFITYEPIPEAHDIFKRLGKVFEQTYTRFLDLQKAEAQAREAQIEAALERVRSKAMAMHKSEDLSPAVAVVFEELDKLNLGMSRCGIGIINKERRSANAWITSIGDQGTAVQISGEESMDLHPLLQGVFDAWIEHQDFSYTLEGNDMKEYYRTSGMGNVKLPESQLILSGDDLKQQYYHIATFEAGGLFAFRETMFSEEAKTVMKRFASVFNLTYKRFLDIQKAEAQAREAQIEAALERVRSKAMAMHKTEDFNAAVAVVFEELEKLDLGVLRCGISVLNKEKRTGDVWVTSITDQGSAVQVSGDESFDIHPLLAGAFDAWLNQQDFHYVLEGEDLTNYYKAVKAARFGLPESQFISSEVDPIALGFKRQYMHIANYHAGGLFAFRETEFPDEAKKVMKRFANVFDLTYKRFLDLQKAEAQARESQIQLALERVRARTMAMQKSDELSETSYVLFEQWKELGQNIDQISIGIIEEDETAMKLYSTLHGNQWKRAARIEFDKHVVYKQIYSAWKKKKKSFVADLSGKELSDLNKFKREAADYQIGSEDQLPQDRWIIYVAFFSNGMISLATEQPHPRESIQLLERFASVFDLTYTRFVDLQKAEAQAREAQIEAALERVRSRTMAMYRSQEIADIVGKIFSELSLLDLVLNRVLIWTFNDAERHIHWWSANPEAEGNAESYRVDYNDTPVFLNYLQAWQKRLSMYLYTLSGEEKKNWEDHLFTNTELSKLPLPVRKGMREEGTIFTTSTTSDYGLLMVGSFEPLSDANTDIIQRFGRVFQQSYTRYLDVQQAEAQAREAKIEAAMEKVRARAMAMQKADELIEVAELLRTEMGLLVEELETSSIYIHHDDSGTTECWYAIQDIRSGDKNLVTDHMTINLNDTWVGREMLRFYRSDQSQTSILMQGENRKEWINDCSQHSKVLQGYYGDVIPERTYHLVKFSNGYMGAASPGDLSQESWALLRRATTVFSLAFTRFSDLKLAEAQAREARIEAALERVRAKAMAMHNSSDLSSAASMVFTELRKLGINPIRCGVGLLNNESLKAPLYSATSSPDGDSLSLVGWVMLEGHPVLEKIYQEWLAGQDYFPELSGESLKSYYEHLLSGLSVPVPDFTNEQKQYGHFFAFSVGCLYAWSDVAYNDDQIKILKRFASIIDLTFRRYMDLQKSEANAREAIKQAALDRIRADIASMRTVSDLDRITPLIWNELTILGLPFIRCGVFLMDESQQLIHTFLSTPDGKAIGAFHMRFDTQGSVRNIPIHWRANKRYIDHWDQEEFIHIADILVQQGAYTSPEQYLKTLPAGGFYLHFLPFLQGMLYVGNTTQLDEEQVNLIQAVADAFSTAYARYEDFNKLEAAKQQIENTLIDLKQTQQQLIQSEKMASLGELTAGIAHEIQNPLNFVNNFSEVSNELLDEMKEEMAKGNVQDAIQVVEGVKQNLEKILHHGKRADAIVKGMLQHSRTSSGQKELTDINALADEYLRLAYHGLRAKDKAFNAKFEIDLDKSIDKINVVPQEIGRVILNLINNAFYTVSEKKRQLNGTYEPTVVISTRKVDDKVEVKVKDNGNGIPQKVMEKIFQPFFTTKPTGQGTGLGLSLSYDIITKGHGGELKVETKEGEGSEFIIQLPA